MNVSGAKVLLTGATGGLGQAIARRMSGAGARLVLSGRRAEVLEGLARELDATVEAVDLADSAAVRALAAAHADADVLIANAGLPASGRLESYDPEQIERALAVNLRAPVLLAHALSPAMVARGSGQLVFMSSLAGKAATAGSSLYNATKFGLRGFASALRAELYGTGVGVSTIMPGFIRDAGMFADSGARLPPGVGTKSPEEVAEATLRAIERNRAEVDVAPIGLRVGSSVANLAPDLSAALTRKLGGARLAANMERGQADKR